MRHAAFWLAVLLGAIHLPLFFARPSPFYSKSVSFENKLTGGPYSFLLRSPDGLKVLGSGVLKEIDGRSVIIFRLNEFPPANVVQPAFIREGGCSDLGPAVLYTSFVRAGASVSTFYRVLIEDLRSLGPLSVAVAMDMSNDKVFACGELKYD